MSNDSQTTKPKRKPDLNKRYQILEEAISRIAYTQIDDEEETYQEVAMDALINAGLAP
jgi:hypothetical protein